MPRLRTILISPLVAVLATGFALAVAQDGGDNRPAPAKTKANAPPPVPPNPARMEKLLKDWEGQSSKLNTLEVSIYRIDLRRPGATRIIMKGMPFSRALSSRISISTRSSWSRRQQQDENGPSDRQEQETSDHALRDDYLHQG